MKNLSVLFTVLLGSMCVFQSCRKDNGESFRISNQDFISQASSNNNLEISAGGMATTKGQTDTIKTFGKRMVVDYTANEAELSALASAKGLSTGLGFLNHHAGNLNILSQIGPQQFDKRFAELMVISQQEAINLFRLASEPNGMPDPEIRSWASGKLPTMILDLQEAEALYISR